MKKGKHKGVHRKRRERAPIPGMLIHQDGSTHERVPGVKWDLIITVDDATSEIYSGFFVEEEGSSSSFQGVAETMAARGIFISFYSDRGMRIQMISAYFPQARGRSERMFKTL